MASGVDARLLKSTKFPPEFSQKVDMQKVNVQVIKKWIANRISDILGNEDDVVIELCFNLVEGVRHPDVKALQIQLTGFLEKDTAAFCKELWNLLLSAQASPQGVPKELLEAKKLELMQEKIEADRVAEETRRRRDDEDRREREIATMKDRDRRDGGRPNFSRGGRRGERAFDGGARGGRGATIREEEATATATAAAAETVDGDGDAVAHVPNPRGRLPVAAAPLQAEASAQIVANQGKDQGLDRGSLTEGETVLVELDDHARPRLTVTLPHQNDAGILLQEAGLLVDVRGHYLARQRHLGDIQAPTVVAADGMRPRMREAGDLKRAVVANAVPRGTGRGSLGVASRVESDQRRIRHATPQAYHSHLFGEKTLMFRKMHHLSIPEPILKIGDGERNRRGRVKPENPQTSSEISPYMSLPRYHMKAEIIRWWLSICYKRAY
ncbi:unnamed protein product [Clonostachys solani]|uniref:PWI domain-containing protein n=1 Tax=Clonostachys solani TaxID=160281 RepID=A0A9N9Z6L0_9HYPO|nr:unnamed protein product [Clonostachys solani]